MIARLILIVAVIVLLCGCSAPPSSTAPESARADEMVSSHEREQTAALDTAIEHATLLNIPATIATLNQIKGRLHEFTAAIAKLIASIEAKAEALMADNERLRNASYASFRTMVWVGGLILAGGIAMIFLVWTRPYAGIAIVLGGSLVAVGIALQAIAPWVTYAAFAALIGSVIAIVVQAWRHWRSVVEIVKVAELAKENLSESQREAIFTDRKSVANQTQSSATKKLVASAQNRIYTKPVEVKS